MANLVYTKENLNQKILNLLECIRHIITCVYVSYSLSACNFSREFLCGGSGYAPELK